MNSGSSALYLAVELLDLPRRLGGDHLARSRSPPTSRRSCALVSCRCSSTSSPTRSTPTSPRSKRSSRRRPRAILLPNLIGNAPDWDAVPRDRRSARPARRRGLLRRARCHAARARRPAHAFGHQPHQLRQLAHHHVRGQRRHGGARRRRPARPRPAAAPLGPALRGAALRLPQGRAQLLGRHRRRPLRQHVHLRRAGLELRAVGDGRRLRPRSSSRSCRPTTSGASATSRSTTASSSRSTPTASCRRGRRPSSTRRGSAIPIIVRPDAGFTAQRHAAVPRGARRSTPARSGRATRCASR